MYLYKIDYDDFTLCKTNLLYTPTVNEDGSVLCIDYTQDPVYQKGEVVAQPVIDQFCYKEFKFLTLFQGRSWAPKLLGVDKSKAYIEFSGETLNHILLGGRSLDAELPNWREQLTEIMLDIDDAGYYKLALYPHSFFIGRDGQLKCLDFYTFINKHNPYVVKSLVEGMIGKMSEHRFAEATVDNKIDFSIFFEQALQRHLGHYWGKQNPFPEIYQLLKARS